MCFRLRGSSSRAAAVDFGMKAFVAVSLVSYGVCKVDYYDKRDRLKAALRQANKTNKQAGSMDVTDLPMADRETQDYIDRIADTSAPPSSTT
jgi:hypothetical protein